MSDTSPDPVVDEFASDARLTMGIDPYERNWMRLSVAMLIGFFTIVTIAGFAMGIQVNGAESEVDPRTVMATEPWATPGLREISPGVYEAYILAQAWSFSPREIEVPVGSKVTIYVTSPDLQHGFKITDTNINMMVVPGQVSKLEYTFDTVGDFPYICHEYCGKGHASMFGTVKVVAATGGESAAPTTTEGVDE
ncbi:MAG: cytochrome c oxidase subunit II [Acidimicrobiales bacterium]